MSFKLNQGSDENNEWATLLLEDGTPLVRVTHKIGEMPVVEVIKVKKSAPQAPLSDEPMTVEAVKKAFSKSKIEAPLDE